MKMKKSHLKTGNEKETSFSSNSAFNKKKRLIVSPFFNKKILITKLLMNITQFTL